MIQTNNEGYRSYITFMKFNELILKNAGIPIIVPKGIGIVSNN